MSKDIQAARRHMWERDPHCRYCGVYTVLPECWPQRKLGRFLIPPPDHMATIDHVYSRVNPDRKIIKKGHRRWVLSCAKCNRQRGAADVERYLSKEEQRRRAESPERYRPGSMRRALEAAKLLPIIK